MNLVSGAGLRLLHFFFLKRIIIRVVSLREQLLQILRRLAGNILYRYTHLKPLRNQGFQRFYALFFQSVFYRYTRAIQSVRQDLN